MHTITAPTPEETVSDLAHFAWCALIALRLAQQDGQALSPMMAHTFLLRWLAMAQKQRRFPKTIALDIDGLLQAGRRNSLAASLQQRLEYLWQSCTSPVDQQSALFRLTYAIEALKVAGWQNISLPDGEWQTDKLLEEFREKESIMLIRKSALTLAFSDDGVLLSALDFLVKGDNEEFIQTLASHNLKATANELSDSWAIMTLTDTKL
ncbi:DUF2913 family protein [Buttiauxella selenatireducens]|uniref:DUF2913 family protein n=1 Tax=Buttiauxella selenatireducens TaxID=3073902 RepID=A0ABY9S7S6_9ENTR|nr:DUF2913 family protein [Buttiauxella sp. R73]WMY72486.1 DUF2913 family protein [Buttiauxella sp. R73]